MELIGSRSWHITVVSEHKADRCNTIPPAQELSSCPSWSNIDDNLYPFWQDELSNKLPPFHEESVTGEAAVLKVFKLTGARKATVAGCRVMTGTLVRGKTLYKVLRNNNVIFEGELYWYV